jgi:glutathione S-transferase
MEELILHHYDFSPFSEKIRLIFGMKALTWRSVSIPSVMPKPELVALTGGYRHTPVLQIGADIFCDTRLIATELDRRFPDRPLQRPETSGLALAVESWAEKDLFWPIARYVSGINAETVDPSLHADRAALHGKQTPSVHRLKAVAQAELGSIEAQLPLIDSMLASGRAFLISDEVSRADLGVYHGLWFLSAMPIDCSSILKPYPSIKLWMKRIHALGTGRDESMTPREAIEVARHATPTKLTPSRAMDFDPALGTVIAIRPEEYRTEEVVGEVVFLDQNEMAIRRTDERAGEVVVHFPRIGYAVRQLS